MVLSQITYPPPPPNAIATFAFTDIAEGTGVFLFQGFNANLAGTISYNLTGDNALFSQTVQTGLVSNTPKNYDLSPFNLPKVIKGTAIVRFSTKGALSTETVSVKLQRVSGVDVTDVGSQNITIDGTPENTCTVMSLTTTHFKKGDILRLRIMAVNTNDLTIGNDPANRDGAEITPAATYPTKLEAYVPFRIDL